MENQHFVSIGLPVYNGGHYLQSALNALLSQTYQNFEIIISDNASTDDSKVIYEMYANKDKRVKYSLRERNMGAANNFKYVLEQASGEYFMWAACDDFWEPEFLAALVQELDKHPEAVVAMSAIKLIDENNSQLGLLRFDGANNPNELDFPEILLRITGGSGVQIQKYNLYIYGCFRTEILKKAFWYYEDAYSSEGLFIDRLFMTQIALIGSFRYVDMPLYHRRIHNSSGYRREKKYTNTVFRPHFIEQLRLVLSLRKMLMTSVLIPASRKKYIFPVMWRFLFLLIFNKKMHKKITNLFLQ